MPSLLPKRKSNTHGLASSKQLADLQAALQLEHNLDRREEKREFVPFLWTQVVQSGLVESYKFLLLEIRGLV